MTQAGMTMDAGPLGRSASVNTGSDAGFWNAGHRPTLIAAFLYFDLAFMVWVLLGPLAPIISKDLGLSPAQRG